MLDYSLKQTMFNAIEAARRTLASAVELNIDEELVGLPYTKVESVIFKDRHGENATAVTRKLTSKEAIVDLLNKYDVYVYKLYQLTNCISGMKFYHLRYAVRAKDGNDLE